MKQPNLFFICLCMFSATLFGQNININGARVVSQSGNYFVLGNGNFILSNPSAANPLALANLSIKADASLTVAPQSYLTVGGTLTNASGADGLVMKSGSSILENSDGVSATVESNLVGGEWHLVSSPVADAQSGIFATKYLQKLVEESNSYMDITSLTEVLTPMKGFAAFSADAFTASYAGALNATSQNYNYTFSGSAPSEGYNLIGNPFASSINWDLVTKDNATMNDAIYKHVNAATWFTYIDGVGIPTNNEKFIAPCQGFLVKAKGNGTMEITGGARTHYATTFYKNSDEIVPNLVRLQVSGNGYTDQAVVRFVPESTSGFDGQFDALKLYGDVAGAAQLYSIADLPLSINSLPETSIVPIGVRIGAIGNYTISAIEINDFSEISLEDTKTGIFTDLLKNAYTFNFVPGENEQRFVLHFGPLSVDENETTLGNIYSYGKTVYINIKDKAKADIYIYTITGQLLVTKLSALGENKINLTKTGNYIVKVVGKENTEVGKVFVK